MQMCLADDIAVGKNRQFCELNVLRESLHTCIDPLPNSL